MKIIGPQDTHRPDRMTGGAAARPRAPTPAARGGAGEGRPASDLSEALADLGARFAAEGEFDQTRVDRIKSAIARGQYRVNAGAVTDKLIQSVRDPLAAPTSTP